MMKILSTEQIREADAFTIKNEPISSIDLMERASRAFVECFAKYYDNGETVSIICGTGNNGGDGLAIGRLLHEKGYVVGVWIMKSDNYSEDCSINLDRLAGILKVKTISTPDDIPLLETNVVIDALFGSGLSRAVSGLCEKVIWEINHSPSERVSVDIPSGLFADKYTEGDVIVNADLTISFQLPKLAFLLPGNYIYVGDWEVVDIGLLLQDSLAFETDYFYIESVSPYYRKRGKFTHKGIFGKGMIISGSHGKMGAAILSCRAALRSGIGLLTAYTPQCGYQIMQTAVPELMVQTDDDSEYIAYPPDLQDIDVIGIGPGLGTHKLTVQALGEILRMYERPMVLDADALNILGEHREMLELIPKGSILTPHMKEFERLTISPENDFHRLELLKEMSADLSVYIILKGAHSVLATPDGQLLFNSTGNPGMATAGSGDVLTGILTALLAQYDPDDAALIGMFIHGLAGDIAAEQLGEEGMIAGDIIQYLPEAFKKLKEI